MLLKKGQMTACLVCLLAVGMRASAQEIPPYDLGGASRPRPDMKLRGGDQYKRVHQTALRYILRGELDSTETFLNEFLAENPEDAETLYMLGILHGQRNEIDKGVDHLRRAIDVGLPEGRLLAGPRKVMEPFRDTELFESLRKKSAGRPIHGPLLGNLTDHSVSVWVRTAAESRVQILVNEGGPVSPDSNQTIMAGPAVRSTAEEDFAVVATIDGLHPETVYAYAVKIDQTVPQFSEGQRFKTFPQQAKSLRFTIAFGGGAGYVPENERMWTTIAQAQPDALLLLGDNVYIDDPESVVMQQYTYQRRQSRPEWRALTTNTPVFTIWDDHDFSTNDSWGGPDVAVPFWKQDWVFPTYRQNWANPGYGGGADHPGCYYRFSIGDVDFFMLDCRYYRTDPRKKPRSMLGPVQKAWLRDALLESKATFRVICSSVPWDYRTKGDSLDTWNGYQEEREEVFRFLEDNQIEGVLLMSADRHRSDAWRIERPDGYDLYEFNSSRLTNQHVHPTMEKAGAIFSFNKPQSFGLVSFDTSADDPQVTYEVVDINGKRPHQITVKRSQLAR